MKPERILLVEDDPSALEFCADVLHRAEYEVVRAESGERAEAELRVSGIDVVVVDLKMPTMGGLEVLAVAKETDPDTIVILITGFPEVETAVKAMKLGASEYLVKPFSEEQLLTAVESSVETRRTKEAHAVLKSRLHRSFALSAIVGQSRKVLKLFDDIRKAASVDANVLILGESGSGKELVAQAIQGNSVRQGKPFLPINCAAIPENLLEAELFGYERGAFTGADFSQAGLLEAADGGTVFFDEVCELSPHLQAKLLRALEEGTVRRLAGRKPVPFDVRFMAATNRDIHEEMRNGRFREDLFFRINVIEIRVPALRERREDIPLLAAHFLEALSAHYQKKIDGITQKAMELLTGYEWPGNVRELRNAVERAVTYARGPLVTHEDLPSMLCTCTASEPQPRFNFHQWKEQTLDVLEKEFLEDALEQHERNVTRAARALGIHRSTLQRLMRRHGLATP